MWRLHQHPLCPFSRKVRLALAEKGVEFDLVKVAPWDAPDEFYSLNPAGRTPVLEHKEKRIVLADSQAICEYLEESTDERPLILGTALGRAEIRRLVALFDEQLWGDVTGPLMHEKYKKRIVLRQGPDSRVLRESMRLVHEHLDYIDWLIDNRRWIAGAQLSLADFAAAAQLSVVDYLGGIEWADHKVAHEWYRVMKSRPAFRGLLADKVDGLPPPRGYNDPNS